MFRRLNTILFLFFVGTNCSAQALNYEHYDHSNGLCGSTVYSIVQDTSGFLWFATQNGLCKFNGRNFINYLPDGIKNNEIIYAYADSKNRIWFSNYSGNMWVKDAFGFKKFELPKQNFGFSTLLEDDDGIFWFNQFKGNGLLQVKNVLTDSQTVQSMKEYKKARVARMLLIDNKATFFSNKTYQWIDDKMLEQPSFKGKRLVGRFYDKSPLFLENNKLLGTNFKPSEILRESQQVSKPFSKRVFVNKNGDIWFAYNNNLNLLKKGQRKPEILIHDILINDILQDKQGNVWVSTMNNGVYFFSINQKKSQVDVKAPSEQRIEKVYAINDETVVVGIGNYGLRKIRNEKIIQKIIPNIPLKARVLDIANFENNIYAVYDLGKLYINDNKGERVISIGGICKTIATDQLGNVWIGGGYALVCFTTKDSIPIEKDDAIFSLHFDANNTIWAGGTKGLMKIDKNRKKIKYLPEIFINDILHDRDNNIWVATMGSGVYKISENRMDSFLLLNNNCVALTYDSILNQVWVGTNNGIARIDVKDNTLGFFTRADGLNSDEVKDVAITGDILWVGTNKGLNKFNLNELQIDSDVPHAYIEAAFVSNSNKSILQESKLGYLENNIEVQYATPNYQDNKMIHYRYKLNDGQWQFTENRSIQFIDLAHGNYEFRIQAIGKNGQIQKNPTILTFKINPPFWKTWWFIVLLLLFCLGLILWLYKRQINKVRTEEIEKREVENKMNSLRMQALQSQMNPHFVFNSMNAIQTFIGRNDQKAALEYLADFGQLMRMSLQHMQVEELSVKDVNEFITLYLKLENMRFDNAIQFTIQLEHDEIAQLKIPPFIIQPIVENSVQHGLNSTRINKKELKIYYYLQEEKKLYCEISDNGIGRVQAQKQTKKHKAVGIANVKRRLSLMPLGSGLKIEDKDINKDMVGTKTTIIIAYD